MCGSHFLFRKCRSVFFGVTGYHGETDFFFVGSRIVYCTRFQKNRHPLSHLTFFNDCVTTNTMRVEALLFISIISLQIFDRIVAKVLHTSHKQNSYIVSTFHSFVVISCSAYYFLIEKDQEVSRAGSIFSASYMLWDIPQLFITKYEPLLPLLIHHSFAGTFLSRSRLAKPTLSTYDHSYVLSLCCRVST